MSRTLSRILSAAAALLLWQAAAAALNNPILLASPAAVFLRLPALMRSPETWRILLSSSGHIALGLTLAMLIGGISAVIAGRFPLAETLLWPYVAVIRSVPVASFIILALIWIRAARLSVFISFLIAFPVVYANLLQGIRAADPRLREMADIYHFTLPRRLRYIDFPQVYPYLRSAASSASGLALKAGIAAEVIGIADGSIGEMLYRSKLYFMTEDLLAWTVLIVLLSIVFEKLLYLILGGIYGILVR